MNFSELQADLRHFAAERDWQPFHTPKNFSTALMVEAAELAEIFQWMTPEESARAHHDAATKQRVGEEIADVLLYLVQLADHCDIDIAQAVKSKLQRNADKHPAGRAITRVSPARSSVAGTHVLLDYENVQPTEQELRALVPDAAQVWVFHGPHQQQVEKRFASFGDSATAVRISQAGKNALDFHLSFYMGYIVSRNQASSIVVVANDKGYEPMLMHAKAMGFKVRRQAYEAARPAAAGRKATAKKTAAMKAPARAEAAGKAAESRGPAPRKAAAKKASAPGPVAAKKAPAKKAAPKKKQPAAQAAVATKPTPAKPARGTAGPTTDMLGKITANLRNMGAKRPARLVSLRRLLKSFLGTDATDDSTALVLRELGEAGVVAQGAKGEVSYPAFGGP